MLAESRETLARDCQLVRPTALNAVPFIYQKIADRIRTSDGDQAQALRDFFGGRIERLNLRRRAARAGRRTMVRRSRPARICPATA